jgi:hypothetical protein
MAPQSYAQRVIADGAVNYWRLGEQSGTVARDEIGGAHGTISGGVTLGQKGALVDGNAAMLFDGALGQVLTPVGTPVLGLGGATLECWVKAPAPEDFKYPIDFKNDGDTSVHGVGFLCGSAGRLHFEACDGTLSSQPGQILPYANGAFHHWVGVVRRAPDNVAELYFDGALAASLPFATAVTLFSGLAASIGARRVTGLGLTGATIDEVAVYPLSLSPAQILAHYQLGVGTFAADPQPSSAASPLVDKALLAGQAVLGAGAGVDVAGCASLAFTVVGNGAVTAGAVQLEEAHDADFTGAWAAMGAPVTVAAGAKTVKLNQTAKVVRARVSTAIVGGSASVSLVAR